MSSASGRSSGRVSGRKAIIFGGGVAGDGLGNGKATALLLAREGAEVAIVDIQLERAEETAAAIRAEGGLAHAFEADVANPETVASAVSAAHEALGSIDILINNVGIHGPGAGLFAYGEDDWDKVFAVNARGTFTTCRQVIPHMLTKGYGRIVNISSSSALRTSSRPPYAYAASKAAVIQLTQSLAIEFASRGIRANCVVPGMINTPHANDAFYRAMAVEEAERVLAARTKTSPTGTQGSPWDIAQSVLFLSDEAISYVNGASLVVDGGFTLTTPSW